MTKEFLGLLVPIYLGLLVHTNQLFQKNYSNTKKW